MDVSVLISSRQKYETKIMITTNTRRSITVKKASQIEGNWQTVTSQKTYICGSTLVHITATAL